MFGSAFSPIPKRVMDGSEPGLDTPAAVLSGAPTDLQARTVRYKRSILEARSSGKRLTNDQHLSPHKDRHPIRRLARTQVAHRLGCSLQGPQMGEPAHGLAVVRRRHAGHSPRLQLQGRRDCICEQAGLRVLRAGAQRAQARAQGLRDPVRVQPWQAEAGEDEVKDIQSERGSRVYILYCMVSLRHFFVLKLHCDQEILISFGHQGANTFGEIFYAAQR